MPSAAAHLFTAVEIAQVDLNVRLAALYGVISFAHEQAYRRANGAPPEGTAAFRCQMRLAEMVRALTDSARLHAVRDFATGPELLKAISDGVAEFGDIARFELPSRAPVDGSQHINRPQAPAEPAERDQPDPGISAPPDPDLATPGPSAAL